MINLGKLTPNKNAAGEVVSWTSTNGLIYKNTDSAFNNKVEHVLAHLTPDPSKVAHTVFNTTKSELLGLLDEAWIAANKVAPDPKDTFAFYTDMGRVIGTNGETVVKLVVNPATNEIVTAYPVLKSVLDALTN